jgi:hypothetical protein
MKPVCGTCRKEITGAVFLLADQPTQRWCSELCRNKQIVPFKSSADPVGPGILKQFDGNMFCFSHPALNKEK